MRVHTEIVVLHDDVPLPDHRAFCPSGWQGDDFDSDGDFYYDGIDGRWTTLELETRAPGHPRSSLVVWTYRTERAWDPAVEEHADLARFLDHVREGRYAHRPDVDAMRSPAVTSLTVETADLGHYREFLETVTAFLRHVDGLTVNIDHLDADGFAARFLGPGGPT